MTIRVVDSKRLDMTDDEWGIYNNIVKSYTTVSNKGEDYFMELFETNDDGIIMFLRPPSKRQTSLEVFLFLMSLQCHQHLRLMHNQIDEAVGEIKKKLATIE